MRFNLFFYPSINSFQSKAVEKYHFFFRVRCTIHVMTSIFFMIMSHAYKMYRVVYSKQLDNFFILHSFWICVYTLYLYRKSFQITLIENTSRQLYLTMHSVRLGFTDYTRFMFLLQWDYRCELYNYEISLNYEKNIIFLALKFGHFVLYLQRALLLKEINLVLKWARPSSLLNCLIAL